MGLPPIDVSPVDGDKFGWRNARGWLSEEEGLELRRLAAGKRVLEIGTFCGRSSLAMAETAHSVICVDSFRGYHEDGMSNTLNEALDNFKRAGLDNKIIVMQGVQEAILPSMDLSKIDMVFYDGDHSEDATGRGIRLIEKSGLPQDATIVFHDYNSKDPGVIKAVDSWRIPRGLIPRIVDRLAIFDERNGEDVVRPTSLDLMLAFPTSAQSLVYGAAQGLFRATWLHHVGINHYDKSLLAACFNKLLCDALNASEAGKITHLAWLHADIAPPDGWIDTLIAEMESHDAVVCAANVAVKDQRGLTSTAIGEPGLNWSPLRRFTVTELQDFPDTFCAEDIGYPGKVLLLNSGCWVADLRHPAFHRTNANDEGKVFFTINDRIVKVDGHWVHQVESEDWFFSRCLFREGVKAVATKKVSVCHIGAAMYQTDKIWGTHSCDEDLRPLWEHPDVTSR